MTYALIDYHVADGVATIRLDDLATLNAFSQAMGREVTDAIGRAQHEARAILLGSVGRAFSSGANLAEGNFALDDPQRDIGIGLERVFNPLILAMRASDIPIVGAIRGAVVGVACGVACSADLIVMGESGFFLEAFCSVGLTPDGGSSYLLAKAIGRVRAMEMMLLGGRLSAARALEWGLINRVVPDHEVDAAALAIATTLAHGPRALGMIRQSAWAALEAPLHEQLERERALQRDAGRTDDFVEGVRSFREKRPASFAGR